jgi:hypothetical protein
MENADYEMRLSCTSGSGKRSGIIKLDTHGRLFRVVEDRIIRLDSESNSLPSTEILSFDAFLKLDY